jgi:hypothetical protein
VVLAWFLAANEYINKFPTCFTQKDFEKRAKSLLVVTMTMPDHKYENFTAEVREFNKKEPFRFVKPPIFDAFNTVSSRRRPELLHTLSVQSSKYIFFEKFAGSSDIKPAKLAVRACCITFLSCSSNTFWAFGLMLVVIKAGRFT